MRPPHLALALLAGLAFGLGFACDPGSGDCAEGTEGCECTADNQCLTGLQCLSEHCVDPNWTPEDDDEDDGQADDDDGDDGGSVDNVGACEDWIDAAECGDFDFSASVDCSVYSALNCDIVDYFNCLSENTACSDGIPDTSGWSECVELARCA